MKLQLSLPKGRADFFAFPDQGRRPVCVLLMPPFDVIIELGFHNAALKRLISFSKADDEAFKETAMQILALMGISRE